MTAATSPVSRQGASTVSTDVLLVGYNGGDFDEYVASMRASGVRQAAYRDVALAAARLDGREMTAMDVLNAHGGRAGPALSNADFLWPVITYLGSFLERGGFRWDYVNLVREQQELLERKLRGGHVRCVAITTTVYVSPQPILEIVALVRRLSPDTRIIVGGPYLSDKPRTMPPGELPNLLTMLGADVYVFSSEGEATLTRVLEVLCRGAGTLADVPNIAYHADGWQLTGTEVESNSLVDNPVEYSLFRRADIGRFLSIRTAKSCPFKCSFCGFPGRAGKYTYLDVDLVERELDQIAELGTVDTLTIIDDTFNVPKPRFKEILRMMIRKDYGFHWNSYLRSDHVDDEALDLMAESGCEGVFLGVESGSATQLKNMNKTSRPEHYLRAIGRCRELGILTYASLIVGFPGETEETLAETLDFLAEARPDFYRAQCWYADPYTPVFNDLDKHRIVGQGFRWAHATMDSQAASAWVNHFFNTVDASCWLPQNGFELWSVYYLRRHGMPVDRIKSYLGAFNDVVRHRVLHGDQAEVDTRLRDRLIDNARRHTEPVTEPAQATRYAPARVSAGLDHWCAELAGRRDVGMPWDRFGGSASGWRLLPTALPTLDGMALADAAGRMADASGRMRRGSDAVLLVGDLDGHDQLPVTLTGIGGGTGDAAATVAARLDEHGPLAYTAESAAQFLVDRGRDAALPDVAVVRSAPEEESRLLARLERLGETVLAGGIEVALVAVPDGRWRIAHRGALSDDDADDLAQLLGSERQAESPPAPADLTPTFAL